MSDHTSYLGASEHELRSIGRVSKALGLIDQRRWFRHRGGFRIAQDTLFLEGWLELPRSAVERIDLEFTHAYTRFMAGGARGGFPSLGFLGERGKPLVVRRTGAEPLYLLLDYGWLSGTSENPTWLPRLDDWLARSPA